MTPDVDEIDIISINGFRKLGDRLRPVFGVVVNQLAIVTVVLLDHLDQLSAVRAAFPVRSLVVSVLVVIEDMLDVLAQRGGSGEDPATTHEVDRGSFDGCSLHLSPLSLLTKDTLPNAVSMCKHLYKYISFN